MDHITTSIFKVTVKKRGDVIRLSELGDLLISYSHVGTIPHNQRERKRKDAFILFFLMGWMGVGFLRILEKRLDAHSAGGWCIL